MKFLLSLLFIAAFFAVGANAQLCGSYTTTLNVLSPDEKAVENVIVQIIPLERDETGGRVFVRDEADKSKFKITFNEGHQLKEDYKVSISAEGFETQEKEISFPHCRRQTFEIRLKAIKTVGQSILTGIVYDPVGAVIPKSIVTAVNQKGEKFETLANENGEYTLNLPFKVNMTGSGGFSGTVKYEITVEAGMPGFEKAVLKDFRFVGAYNGKMRLDFALDVISSSHHEPCGYGGACIQETAPIESKPTEISGKLLQQPLEELPKEQNKTKRKNRNNKQ